MFNILFKGGSVLFDSPRIMYISPIETPKVNNLDIRITYEGYSLRVVEWVALIRFLFGVCHY